MPQNCFSGNANATISPKGVAVERHFRDHLHIAPMQPDSLPLPFVCVVPGSVTVSANGLTNSAGLSASHAPSLENRHR